MAAADHRDPNPFWLRGMSIRSTVGWIIDRSADGRDCVAAMPGTESYG